jgi:protein-L-isoaspartate(D-aspartate) O-methyltransferase
MVDTQVRPHDVTKFPVLDAMLTVPREVYVPDTAQDMAYVDGPVPLGNGRYLVDARATGKMLDALDISPADLVLEIGAGMGYITALLAHLAEAVVAIEEDDDLAREAEAALASQQVDNAMLLQAPLTDGSAKHGPFDAIVVSGGVETLAPGLIDQLKEGGRIMAIFMDGPLGEARLGRKIDGRVSWRMEFNATASVLPGFARAPDFVF